MPILKGTSSTKKPKPVPKPPEGQAGRAGKSTGSTTYDAPDTSGSSLAAPRGTKVTKGMTPGNEQDLVTASKGGKVTSGPFKTTGGGDGRDGGGATSKPGPWESGSKVGKWEAGAVGKWAQSGSKTEKGTVGVGGGGSRPRLGGALRDPGLVGSGGRISYSDGEEYTVGSDNTTEDGFGSGGGGGTGNPLAGAASALKATSIKTADLGGKSVAEAVKGAKRTRKTGGVRTQ